MPAGVAMRRVQKFEGASGSHVMVRIGRASTAAPPLRPSDELMYSQAAFQRQQAGDLPGALELHMQAVALGPRNAAVLTGAADALRMAGRLREAIGLFDRALALDSNLVAALYGRALSFDSSGAVTEAERDYRRVAELAPQTAHGFAGLASMQALHGRLDEARANAARAAALGPNDSGTMIAQARCDMLAGDHAAAAHRLRQLTARSGLPYADEIVALGLLGEALDRLDAREEAFAAWSRANRRFADAHGGPDAPPVARREAEALAAAVARLEPVRNSGWRTGMRKADRHIFLLGYPRSGTTLAEQVLGSIDGVITLEEEPTLALAAALYLSPQGIEQLMTLPEAELDRLRTDYWDRVESAGVNPAGKTFVDMDPFKAPCLPLIARLFPDAKIVIMRRDPRDVVWSCFRQTFVCTPVTYEFASLERAARHYAAVMELIAQCRTALPLDVHELRYEELVRDFDATTRRLCAFAGLPWSPELRNFPQRARSAKVKTASAAQVRRPLYNGSGQWRRYAALLAPVLPLIERWV